MSLPEATLFVANYLAIDVGESYHLSDNLNKKIKKLNVPKIEKKVIEKEVSSEEILKQVKKDIENFESGKDEYFTFKNDVFKKEALAIAPFYLYKETQKEALELFREMVCLDLKNQTLILKIVNYDNQLISYKRRRYGDIKWCTKKATSPNSQCFARVRSNCLPIYIVEGSHDLLVSILMDINFIAIPNANYKRFDEYELNLLKDREVCFLPDIEDTSIAGQGVGVNSMLNLANQIQNIAEKVVIVNLVKFISTADCTKSRELLKKLDLGEVVWLFKNLEQLNNELLYYSQQVIYGREF